MGDDIGTAVPAFFAFGGATIGLVVANVGAAYGMSKSGVSHRGRIWSL